MPATSVIVSAVLVLGLRFTLVPSATEDQSPDARVRTVDSTTVYKLYSKIDGLFRDADVAAIIRVDRVAQKGLDRGRYNSASFAIPYNVYEASVLETLKGEVGNSIFIQHEDSSSLSDVPSSDFAKGETVLVFLNEYLAMWVPTLTVTDGVVYLLLAYDNSVFDVERPAKF